MFRRFKTTLDFEEPIREINTTPLVDVMLVLLIIFLITIPVINASIKVDLPEERFNDRSCNGRCGCNLCNKGRASFL